ncbi:MAG TPA: hypothetical protein VHZ06_10275 [Marmoricola sp.]|nr:hypothetical protein [Marmoricola sp.]
MTASPQARTSTNPTSALLSVLLTLVMFLVSFIGFLIAPWVVLGVGALAYALRAAYNRRRSGKPLSEAELDGAIDGFGLGAPQ